MPTLTVDAILNEVLDDFVIAVPALNRMGRDFRPGALKLNKTYTAHIAGTPTVGSYSAGNGGYKNAAQSARSLLTDIDITVDQHKCVSLKFEHLNAIKDDKNEYDAVIRGAAYALAKEVINSIVAKMTSREITQSSTYAVNDSDYDAVNNVRDDMNLIGASPLRRAGIINTSVASILSLDSRVQSADYRGEMSDVNAFRRFRNLCGFEEVMEWPELPSNNGSAITIASGEADDEVITTSAAHGLLVGDRVTFPTLTGGSGLTAVSGVYYVVSVPTSTTLTVSATSGGSAVNFTTDISAGTIQRYENVTGVFWEPRGVAVLAGIPENAQELAVQLGAPPTSRIVTQTHEGTGLTMMAITEAEQGTLDGFLHLAMVWGSAVGRQVPTNSAGDLTDYAAHRLISA